MKSFLPLAAYRQDLVSVVRKLANIATKENKVTLVKPAMELCTASYVPINKMLYGNKDHRESPKTNRRVTSGESGGLGGLRGIFTSKKLIGFFLVHYLNNFNNHINYFICT